MYVQYAPEIFTTGQDRNLVVEGLEVRRNWMVWDDMDVRRATGAWIRYCF